MGNRAASMWQRELDADFARSFLLPIFALAIGSFSYGKWWPMIGLSIFFPVLLFRAPSRSSAFFIALLFHLGATRSLGIAAGHYYGGAVFFGVLIWVAGNLWNGLIYAALWHPKERLRIFTVPLAILLTALPPLGVLGWANPLTAAGVIYPGTGVSGFIYLIGLYAALAMGAKGFIKGLILLSLWCQLNQKIPDKKGWEGLSTHFPQSEVSVQSDFKRQTALIESVRRSKNKVVVLPEGMVESGWNEVSERLWQRSLEDGKSVLLGVEINPGAPNERKENAMAFVDKREVKIYLQRQAIPFSMWLPFASGYFNAHWFENPIVDVNGTKAAPLICYEGFLVWPIVHSALMGAEKIVGTGNFWWAKEEGIPEIHASIIKSWSRLFSIPYTLAVNR